MTELALIAFDGLDPRTVYDHQDKLPTLSSFMEDSMHGKWATPGHTIPSFTATLTGKQYNVVNFHWDEGKGQYQRHTQVPHDMLWELTDSSMTLLNIPTLYPPQDIDDTMVCGFLTPDSLHDTDLARPVEVQEMLNAMDYVPDVHADRTYDELGGQGMLDYLEDMMKKRMLAAEKLIDEYDSDLFYGVWTATDRWFHQCHKHQEDPLPMYRNADEILNHMLEILPDDIPIIAFSDHGFAHYSDDDGVHKGHMYDGWYAVNADGVHPHRNDAASIFDLLPTVINYLDGDMPEGMRGKTMFHRGDQRDEVDARLRELGYKE